MSAASDEEMNSKIKEGNRPRATKRTKSTGPTVFVARAKNRANDRPDASGHVSINSFRPFNVVLRDVNLRTITLRVSKKKHH